MALMTMKWTPDPETAEIFATYAEAIRTERDLKADVRQRAEAALKAGATGTQLARLTGMTPEVFRRMARDLALPVDPRYAERAAASRKRPAPERVAPEPVAAPADPMADMPPWLRKFPKIAALSLDEAREQAARLETSRPEWFAENREDCTAEPKWVDHAMLAADASDPAGN